MSITLFEATVRLDSALRAKAFVPILFSYLLYWGDAKKIRIQSPLSSLISTKNISFNKTIFFLSLNDRFFSCVPKIYAVFICLLDVAKEHLRYDKRLDYQITLFKARRVE